MTFRELKRTIFSELAASTDWFGESLTVQPPEGPARTIRAKVKHRAQTTEDQAATGELEQLAVRVALDEATTDAAGAIVGGIGPNPERGYRLWRAHAVDPDRRPFIFRGEVAERSTDTQLLTFVRPRRSTHRTP